MPRKGDNKAEAISSTPLNYGWANGQQGYPDGSIRRAGKSQTQQTTHFVAFLGSIRSKHNVYEASRQLEFEHNVAFSIKD
jgi:hypothetical protein